MAQGVKLAPIQCLVCQTTFKPRSSKTKFCSIPCSGKGIQRYRTTDKPKVCKQCEIGFLPTLSRAQYCSRKCFNQAVAKRGYRYLGDNAKYSALHKWLIAHRPKSGVCEWCMQERKTAWANLTGQYLREVKEDWAELCYSCHAKYDKTPKPMRISYKN